MNTAVQILDENADDRRMTRSAPAEATASRPRPSRPPSTATLLCLSIALLLAACGETRTDPARTALDRFAAALSNKDRDALRDCLANDSIAALDQLLQTTRHRSGDLVVEASAAQGKGRVDFAVRDAQGQRGTFVVVRESGHWRVDLIESAIKSGGVTTGAGFEVHRGADPDEVAEAVARDSLRTR